MDQLIPRFGLALAIGLLVGLERGWRERDEPAGSRTAGIRTYSISGLLGGVFAALAAVFGQPSVFVAGFLGFATVFAIFALREARRDNDFSVTGVVAALSVFALGGLAVSGDYQAAAAAGTALAATLASREWLHGLLQRLSWVELRSALMLAVMTAIILPLLPDHTIDPWGGLNPWEIWFFTVLTAAISYLGYIAVRVLGPTKGLVVSALAGALISSTAVTLAFARSAKAGGDAKPLAGGAALAAMVSILRVATIVLLVQPRMAGTIAAPMLAAACAFGASGFLLLTGVRDGAIPVVSNRNPFDLTPLMVFAATFGIVAVASSALVGQLGSGGLIATSALSGTFDVDVATLTATRMAGQVVSLETAGQATLAALGTNAIGRVGVAILMGPPGYWLRFAAATLVAAMSAVIAYLLMPLI